MEGSNELPFKTGLDMSIIEDLNLLFELEKYAKYHAQLPYEVETDSICEDSEGAEGEVRLAKNIKDGQTYAAKIRFNPGTERKNRNNKELITIAYKRFLKEVVGMS